MAAQRGETVRHTKGAPGHETTVHYAGAFVHDRQDVLALADHLEVQGTNRVMRNQESLEHHLGLSGLMLHLCRIRQGVRAVPPRMLAKISSAPFVRR